MATVYRLRRRWSDDFPLWDGQGGNLGRGTGTRPNPGEWQVGDPQANERDVYTNMWTDMGVEALYNEDEFTSALTGHKARIIREEAITEPDIVRRMIWSHPNGSHVVEWECVRSEE